MSDYTCVHLCFQTDYVRGTKELFSAHLRAGGKLCSGSRNHGCQGCFCRKLSTNFQRPNIVGACNYCGKFMFDLLDWTWQIRQGAEIFSNRCFSSSSIDCSIDAQVHANVELLKLGVMKRSKLIAIYLEVTHIMTELTTAALARRAMENQWKAVGRDPFDDFWCRDETFPLHGLRIIGRDTESNFFQKYQCQLTKCALMLPRINKKS